MQTLKELAETIGARYIGEDMAFRGAHFDSRCIQPGELFIALKGENQDGHDFIPDAIGHGAAAVMVDHDIPHLQIPQIIVDDTLKGMGALAKAWRANFHIPIIGLTGSCGKTTTKEMIASILKQRGEVLATQGNYNNAYGLPLTLLQLNALHQYAVLEMGTNSPGEIAYITDIARPTVAMITNIHASHLEKLGSFEGVSREKSDIFTLLPAEGIAVINLDEPFAKTWQDKISTEHRLTYSLNQKADVTAKHIHNDNEEVEFDLVTPLGEQSIRIPLPGMHIVMNALAAATAAMALGANLENVAKGLGLVAPIKGRMVIHHLNDHTVLIDDTYNASFPSVKNAIETLSHYKGKRIFVMSNMGELGEYAEQFHSEMGALLKMYGFDHVLLFGNEALLQHTLKASGPNVKYYASKPALIADLKAMLGNHTVVLVKGSRANAMEEVVKALMAIR